VLFADVRLQPGDDAQKLKRRGLPVSSKTPRRFAQPCCALEAGCCRIYTDRPSYCQKFACLLLQKLQASAITNIKALSTVRTARDMVQKVEKLLIKAGAEDAHLPLRTRFQGQVTRMEMGQIPAENAAVFSELTLAYHHLNLVLKKHFLP
jgi:hypothetical protein